MSESPHWQEEVLFFKGDDYYEDVLNQIDQAQSSIDLESYIFADDEIGKTFENALLRAQKRGVKVRLMVDGFGSIEWINTHSTEVLKRGLHFRIYNPILLFRQFMMHDFKINSILNISKSSPSFNKRNHRKSCTIDNKVAWVGSMNISRVHSGKVSQEHCWRDTAVRIRGDLSALKAGFDYIWDRSSDPEKFKVWKPRMPEQGVSSPYVRSNYTAHLRKQGFQELLLRLGQAKQRIFLTTAYMAPSSKFVRALSEAAGRGVDVRVVLPQQSDVIFMPWVAHAFYKELLEGGIKIFEYLPCILHAKTVIIDDWAKVGSTNLNGRSLRQDLEVDITLRTSKSLDALLEQFNEDLSKSEKIKIAEDNLKSFAGRLILRTFKDWV